MALQNLCIDVIVCEFRRYYLAFSKGDDANFKLKFEFLQRMYSNQIAPILFEKICSTKKEKVPKYYTEMLVNKYLKDLDTEWLKDCPWESIAAKFAEIGSNLETVHFGFQRPWQDIFGHLSNLKRVTFDRGCNDEILKCITKSCRNIEEINASSSHDVTDTGIKYLCLKENGENICPKLKKLCIDSRSVSKAGIVHLIKNLRSLQFTNYGIVPRVLYSLHKNDLSTIRKIQPYSFTSLNLPFALDNEILTAFLKICISLCPHLKSLSCYISKEEHLDLISSLDHLEKLHIKCSEDKCSKVNLSNLKGGKLKSLTVSGVLPSVSTVVKSCPCLSYLHFDSVCSINDFCFQPKSKRLKTWGFKDAIFDPATAQSISSSVLEEIIFTECSLLPNEFKADFLMYCGHFPIKKICFIRSLVDMYFVRYVLVNWHSLMCLTLKNCNLHSEEILELYRFAQALPKNLQIYIDEDGGDIYDNYVYHKDSDVFCEDYDVYYDKHHDMFYGKDYDVDDN